MLSALGALALFSAPAQANPPVTVHCDQTLTHSVKLANNLTNCPNNGLVVGADNVTLDLNGHTIDGDGQLVADCPPPPGPDCDAGVQNTGGYTGVTIEGGKLREFAYRVEARARPPATPSHGLVLESAADPCETAWGSNH